MKNYCLAIILFCGLLSQAVLAQEERVLLGGVLLNHVTGEPVMAAHVMNLTDSLATISSPDGTFRVPVHAGDSLVFTSIGYHTKAVIISNEILEMDFVEVRMVQREYQLGEVEVNPFGTKEQFRQKFMELEVDDGTIEIVGVKKPSKERRTIPITEDKNEIKKAKHLFKSPASFLYGNLSKDAKKRQELHKLNAQKEKHRYNYQKYNEEVVNRITGYEGATLIEFMDYCNLSERDIYRYTDYELAVLLLNKQRSFEHVNQQSGQ